MKFLCEFLRLFLINNLFRFLDQCKDIAHPQDSGGQTVWMKNLQRIKILTRTDKFNRSFGNLFYRKRGATPGITLHFGEDNTGDRKIFIKFCSNIYRILTCHRIRDKQNLGRADSRLNACKFSHQFFIDMQTACGIDDQGIIIMAPGDSKGIFADVHRVLLRLRRMHGHINPFAEHPQLLNSCRPVHVSRHQIRAATFFL